MLPAIVIDDETVLLGVGLGITSVIGELLICSLSNIADKLHDRIYLIATGHGEGLTVVVAAASTGVGGYSPLAFAELVAYDFPLCTTLQDIACREEADVLVHVVKGAADEGHVVLVHLDAACTSVTPTGAHGVGLGCNLTCLVLKVDAETLQTAILRTCDEITVMRIVNADRSDIGERQIHHVVTKSCRTLLTLVGVREYVF